MTTAMPILATVQRHALRLDWGDDLAAAQGSAMLKTRHPELARYATILRYNETELVPQRNDVVVRRFRLGGGNLQDTLTGQLSRVGRLRIAQRCGPDTF